MMKLLVGIVSNTLAFFFFFFFFLHILRLFATLGVMTDL